MYEGEYEEEFNVEMEADDGDDEWEEKISFESRFVTLGDLVCCIPTNAKVALVSEEKQRTKEETENIVRNIVRIDVIVPESVRHL